MVEQNRRTSDAELDPDQRELQLELIAKIKQLYPQKLAMLKAQLNFSRCQAEGTYTILTQKKTRTVALLRSRNP
jgi:hypothetical protein